MPSFTWQQKSSLSSSQWRRDDNDHDSSSSSSSSTKQILVADNNVVDQMATGKRRSFNNRGLVMFFFSLCVFLPVSQWIRLLSTTTTNHHLSLPLLDYFNILDTSAANGSSSSSSTTLLTSSHDSMADIAMLGSWSKYHAAVGATIGAQQQVETNNVTTKAESSGVGGGAAGGAKEGIILPLQTQITASLSPTAPAEMCPTIDMTMKMETVHAVTEANEDGFFIRTLYPKTYPMDEIMEDNDGKQQQLLFTTTVPNNNVTKVVVRVACEFRHNLPNSNHFPHTMQQLYRCWSWWQYAIQKQQQQEQQQQHQHQQSPEETATATALVVAQLQPVLVLKRNRVGQQHHQQQQRRRRQGNATPSMLENRFVQGFLDALKTSIHLVIVYQNDDDDDKELLSTTFSNDNFSVLTKPKLESNRDLYDYRMYSIQDGPNLRTAVLQAIIINSTSKRRVLAGDDHGDDKNKNIPPDIATETVCNGVFPRITILNRRKNRRILNVQELQHAIHGLFHAVNNSKTNDTTTQPPITPLVDNVRIEYFEGGRSFAEQVSVLASTDLLISPHGAQLTGLPFLPSPCSAVLEIFPRGYWIPKFFGSLAATSGVHQHACLYLGAATTVVNRTHQVQEATRTVRDRFRTRSQNMCLPMNKTIQAIQQMIISWQQCCDSNVHQESSSTTTTRP